MKLTLLGGVDTVTGSQHLLEANGAKVLRDCGLFQGSRREAREVNRRFGFEPTALDALVLSHAHIDHCGNIPSLVRAGYRGPIHATTATVALCDVMLRDSARIQEQDAAYLNQKTNRSGEPPVEPLYTTADAERALVLFRGARYGCDLEVAPGVSVHCLEAGHILGAALTVFTLRENGRAVRVGFAFDLGRKGLPLIRDPETIADVDTLVIESTYGDRPHDDAALAQGQLRDVVRRTLDRGGRVLIPSFALERAQEVLYHLSGLVAAGELPALPVFVDSPMATAVTRIFERSTDYLDEEFRELRRRVGLVMTPPWVRFVGSVEESKALNAGREPCIVIAASGMCEHGRILHHLKHGVEDPRNAIVLVGYQAEHTLGRRLAEGETRVRIFGDWFERRAEVVSLAAFSAHADRNDLIDYVTRVAPRRTVLVHGERKGRGSLAKVLRKRGLGGDIVVPDPGASLDL